MKMFRAAVLQFIAIWWLKRWIKVARTAVMAVQPADLSDRQPLRQLLIDVSIIATHDAGTGVQRVVRCLLLELIQTPPPGFEVRPVRATRRASYRYANRYLASLTSSDSTLDDEDIQVAKGDIFLGLDLASRIVPRRQLDLLKWRAKGVRCAFVVYDFLPFIHPHWFTPRTRRSFRHWLSILAIHADFLLCISRSVSNEAHTCVKQRFGLFGNAPAIRWFHLGSDIKTGESRPLGAAPHPAALGGQHRRRTVLMVGTIEPRKGHAQVLDAFDLLWREGSEEMLVIAGKQGWDVESLVNRLRLHPELDRRLLWFPDASDALLALMYQEFDGLVMASEAEGFGLPLVEAARSKMPLFARDLAVFREVAGNHATYFNAKSGIELAPQLREWLGQLREDTAPPSDTMKSLTWSASSEQLKALILELDRQQ